MPFNLRPCLGSDITPQIIRRGNQCSLIALQYLLALLGLGEGHIIIRRLSDIIYPVIINHTLTIKSGSGNVNVGSVWLLVMGSIHLAQVADSYKFNVLCPFFLGSICRIYHGN